MPPTLSSEATLKLLRYSCTRLVESGKEPMLASAHALTSMLCQFSGTEPIR